MVQGVMMGKCPGSQQLREPVPELFECPECGAEVEIWSDEMSRRCHSCGHTVAREIDNAWCAQWCAYAKECIGVERYEELVKQGILTEDSAEEICIPERLKQFMRQHNVPIPGEDAP